VAIWFWFDASASMNEASRVDSQITKLAYARAIFACLAAVAQRQGDAFGLIVANQGRIHYTPASRGPRQMHRVLAQLNATQALGALPDAETIKAHLHFARAPSLIFAVSDFLDWPSSNSEALLRLRSMGHDVRALCLQTQAERDASFVAHHAYCDPENPAKIVEFTEQNKHDYQVARTAHYETLRLNCKQRDIPLLQATIEQDIGKVLRAWLRLAGRA
jgi:uncharacterized protein (DUF58 family)